MREIIAQGTLCVGDKVTYWPSYSAKPREKGVVKSLHPDHNVPGRIGFRSVFVVYHCDGDWSRFAEYTAALTKIEDLKIGWEE